MPEREWEEGFKIVEVIEVTGPVETVRCVIGAWPPANKAVCLSIYRDDELVHEETFGFGPTLPMAELVSDLEEHLRNDERAVAITYGTPRDRLSTIAGRHHRMMPCRRSSASSPYRSDRTVRSVSQTTASANAQGQTYATMNTPTPMNREAVPAILVLRRSIAGMTSSTRTAAFVRPIQIDDRDDSR